MVLPRAAPRCEGLQGLHPLPAHVPRPLQKMPITGHLPSFYATPPTPTPGKSFAHLLVPAVVLTLST